MNYAALFLHRVFLPSERRSPPASVRPSVLSSPPSYLSISSLSLFAPVIFRLRMPKAARKKEERKKQILVHVSSEFGRSSDIGSYQNHNNVLDIHQGSVAKSCQFSCRLDSEEEGGDC